jgi:hypothetical protein
MQIKKNVNNKKFGIKKLKKIVTHDEYIFKKNSNDSTLNT